MPFEPPVPLVTTTGRVELTRQELEQINLWLDHRRPFGTADRSSDAVVVDVLRRLLGHAMGTMAPRVEEQPPKKLKYPFTPI